MDNFIRWKYGYNIEINFDIKLQIIDFGNAEFSKYDILYDDIIDDYKPFELYNMQFFI